MRPATQLLLTVMLSVALASCVARPGGRRKTQLAGQWIAAPWCSPQQRVQTSPSRAGQARLPFTVSQWMHFAMRWTVARRPVTRASSHEPLPSGLPALGRWPC